MSDWGSDESEDLVEADGPGEGDGGAGPGEVDEQIAPGAPGSADSGGAESALVYGSVDEFVRENLRFVYRRRIDGRGQGRVWAAKWWEHDEAVIRLEALWRAWEHLRQDPGLGMSLWWRDHADHHMPILFSPDGPFARCTSELDQCKPGDPLPYLPPPAGMFPDVRTQAQ